MEGPNPTPKKRAPRVADVAALEALTAELNALPAGPSLEAVKDLLGKNYLGPEVLKAVLGVRDVGTAPPLPRDIIRILNEDCQFRPGRKVKDTHLLVFVPAAVDGAEFTINKLRSMTKDKGTIFYNQDWYDQEPFAKTAQAGQWVLMPKYLVPGTLSQDYPTQSNLLARNHPQYKTAQALGLITGLVLNKLNGGDNGDFATLWGWCEDISKVSAPGARVNAGNFDASGLGVYGDEESNRDSNVGRAVFRNLN